MREDNLRNRKVSGNFQGKENLVEGEKNRVGGGGNSYKRERKTKTNPNFSLRFDSRKSIGRELKLVYSTRATSRCQKQNVRHYASKGRIFFYISFSFSKSRK